MHPTHAQVESGAELERLPGALCGGVVPSVKQARQPPVVQRRLQELLVGARLRGGETDREGSGLAASFPGGVGGNGGLLWYWKCLLGVCGGGGLQGGAGGGDGG